MKNRNMKYEIFRRKRMRANFYISGGSTQTTWIEREKMFAVYKSSKCIWTTTYRNIQSQSK